MQFRGEWWIDDSGNAMFADGDIGDMNHEAYIIDLVSRELLDMMEIYVYDEYTSLEDNRENIYAVLTEESDWSEEDEKAWHEGHEYSLMEQFLVNKYGKIYNDIPIKDMFRCVLKQIDPRNYAMEYLGWIRVVNDNAQAWMLDRVTLKNLAEGLYDAYSEDLIGFELLPDDEQPTFTIEALNTGTLYENVPFGIIDSGQPTRLNPYRNRYIKPQKSNNISPLKL